MEILLLLIYSFFAWLVFFKFKLLPWNITSQVITVTIPIIGITILIRTATPSPMDRQAFEERWRSPTSS